MSPCQRLYTAIHTLRDVQPLRGDVHARVARFVAAEPTGENVTAHLVPMRAQGAKRATPNKVRLLIDGAEHVIALGDVRHAIELRIFTAVIDTHDADFSTYADDLKALGVDVDSVETWLADVRAAVLVSEETPTSAPYGEVETAIKLTFRSRAVPAQSYVPFVPRVIEQQTWWNPSGWKRWG